MLIVELARRVMALLAGQSERWHVSSERRNNTTQNAARASAQTRKGARTDRRRLRQFLAATSPPLARFSRQPVCSNTTTSKHLVRRQSPPRPPAADKEVWRFAGALY